MAIATRQVRLTALNRGGTISGGAISGGTTIDGAVAIEWSHEANVAEGTSNAEIGPTSVDIRGWTTRGTITVDDHAQAVALEDAANASLCFRYTTQGGGLRAGRFASVSFGEVSEIEYPAGDSNGPTSRFQVGFVALYGESDTAPASILTTNGA